MLGTTWRTGCGTACPWHWLRGPSAPGCCCCSRYCYCWPPWFRQMTQFLSCIFRCKSYWNLHMLWNLISYIVVGNFELQLVQIIFVFPSPNIEPVRLIRAQLCTGLPRATQDSTVKLSCVPTRDRQLIHYWTINYVISGNEIQMSCNQNFSQVIVNKQKEDRSDV